MIEQFNLCVDMYLYLLSVLKSLSIGQYTIIGVFFMACYFCLSILFYTLYGTKYSFDDFRIDSGGAAIIGLLWGIIYIVIITVFPIVLVVLIGALLNNYVITSRSKSKKNKK